MSVGCLFGHFFFHWQCRLSLYRSPLSSWGTYINKKVRRSHDICGSSFFPLILQFLMRVGVLFFQSSEIKGWNKNEIFDNLKSGKEGELLRSAKLHSMKRVRETLAVGGRGLARFSRYCPFFQNFLKREIGWRRSCSNGFCFRALLVEFSWYRRWLNMLCCRQNNGGGGGDSGGSVTVPGGRSAAQATGPE